MDVRVCEVKRPNQDQDASDFEAKNKNQILLLNQSFNQFLWLGESVEKVSWFLRKILQKPDEEIIKPRNCSTVTE